MKFRSKVFAALLTAGCAGLPVEGFANPGPDPGRYQREAVQRFTPAFTPIAERIVTTTRVVHRHPRHGAGRRITVKQTITVTELRYRNPRTVVERSSYILAPIGERVEVPVVGGRQTIRTTPTAVGEGPTEPGPTVAPAYPNAWVDYANPYR